MASLLHTCWKQKQGALGLTVFTEYCHRAGVNASTVDWPLCVSVLRLISLDQPYPPDFARQLTQQLPQQQKSQQQQQAQTEQQQPQSQQDQLQAQPQAQPPQSQPQPQPQLQPQEQTHQPKIDLLGQKPISPQEWAKRQDEAFSRLVNVLLAYLVPPSRLFNTQVDVISSSSSSSSSSPSSSSYNSDVSGDMFVTESEGGRTMDDNTRNTTTTGNNSGDNSKNHHPHIQIRRQG